MAPVKKSIFLRKTITTRSKASATNQNENPDDLLSQQRGKRKADLSPLKNDRGVKRSALGNLTNAVVQHTDAELLETDVKSGAPATKQSLQQQTLQTISNNIGNNKKTTASKIIPEIFNKPDPDGPKTRGATKILTRAASQQQLLSGRPPNTRTKVPTSIGHALKSQISAVTTTIVKTKELTFDGVTVQTTLTAAGPAASHQGKPKRRISNEFEKTEDSLYVSALEDITSSGSMRLSDNFGNAPSRSNTPNDHNQPNDKRGRKEETPSPRKGTPDGVEDYDLANWNDVFQVSHYAHDIFNYQKERELLFVIPDYMAKQPHISKWMRALLVDWMVEIQESFELNHETLYLAVKIVDIYLTRAEILKDSLQLLGAAALFIAAKYDERVPPTVDDFHYICDGAYQRRELLLMEMSVLKTIGYDLGIPISYRFLRRYARVNRIDMPVLTLARYILEYSLMDYAVVQIRDSKLACAALFIAMRMSNMQGWNATLEYYSGYKIDDFAEVAVLLNNIMTRKPKESLNTVRHKYSHELFFESAKKPFITDIRKLFDTTGYLAVTPLISTSTSSSISTRSQQASSI